MSLRERSHPRLLRSYTAGAEFGSRRTRPSTTRCAISTRSFPGLRFRVVDEQGAIRPHIKMFVDGDLARRLDTPIGGAAELMIVGALSGG